MLLTVAPSANPAKVPDTASVPSFSMIVKVSLPETVKPPNAVGVSATFVPIVTVPVTSIWSWSVAVLPRRGAADFDRVSVVIRKRKIADHSQDAR